VARKVLLSTIAGALLCGTAAPTASAASPIRLSMSEGAAFSILGHSCGGIQQKVYVRGFAANGYPQANVEMSTTCGGSGRGGGGGSTTYKGTASFVSTWFGETRSHGALQGPLTAEEATDAHGDRVYNVGTAAYLETGTPPLQPPAPPTVTGATVVHSDEPPEDLRVDVSWTVASETAGLLKSATATATPVGSPAPVQSATVSSYFSSAVVHPLEPNTTYDVTVTSTDAEGMSAPSAAVEIKTPNSDGEVGREIKKTETCASNSGTIKLKPGLTENPAVQSITVTGRMSGCAGPLGVEAGKYTAHLTTTEAVTCAALSSATLEGTSSKSFSIKWLPAEEGSSKGSLSLPLSEVPLTGLSGALQGCPLATSASISAGFVTESFIGGSTCGIASGSKKAKPVKHGNFSTGEVEIA
jgi:hypothetical protein